MMYPYMPLSDETEIVHSQIVEKNGVDTILVLPAFLKVMPIFFTAMQKMEESKLPSLFTVSGYQVFFWSNEDGEQIHVHVCKGKPSPNATNTL